MENENKTFSPTVSWMSNKYNEMNKLLFDGSLGPCQFEIFTKGSGSQGKTLGYFLCSGRNLKADRRTRRIFKETIFDRIDVDKDNFYEMCKPIIALNGNYVGLEKSFLTTLVHEMCHYYTYMRGLCPRQAHGPEFRHICSVVAYRSNGEFTIERVANAEQMIGLELNDVMKDRKDKREMNKKSSISAIFQFRSDGEVWLSTTSNQSIISELLSRVNSGMVNKIVISTDKRLIDLLFEKGYRKNFRTLKFWNVTGKDWLNILDNIDKRELVNKNMVENHNKVAQIIKEVVDNYLDKENKVNDDNVIDINFNINLGLHSPLEF